MWLYGWDDGGQWQKNKYIELLFCKVHASCVRVEGSRWSPDVHFSFVYLNLLRNWGDFIYFGYALNLWPGRRCSECMALQHAAVSRDRRCHTAAVIVLSALCLFFVACKQENNNMLYLPLKKKTSYLWLTSRKLCVRACVGVYLSQVHHRCLQLILHRIILPPCHL